MNQKPSVRKQTDLERIIITALNKTISGFNAQLNCINTVVETVNLHLVDRMNDRDVDPAYVNDALKILSNDHLCEFIYDCERIDKPFVQFMIQYKQLFFIHGTYRKTRSCTLITFRTVVPYREWYKPDDLLFKVT